MSGRSGCGAAVGLSHRAVNMNKLTCTRIPLTSGFGFGCRAAAGRAALRISRQPAWHRCGAAAAELGPGGHRSQGPQPETERLSRGRDQRREHIVGHRTDGVGSVNSDCLPRQAAEVRHAGVVEGAGLGPGRPAIGVERDGAVVHGTAAVPGLEGGVDRVRSEAGSTGAEYASRAGHDAAQRVRRRETAQTRDAVFFGAGAVRGLPRREQGGRCRSLAGPYRLRQARAVRHLRRYETRRHRPQRHRRLAGQRALLRAPREADRALSDIPRRCCSSTWSTPTAAHRAW